MVEPAGLVDLLAAGLLVFGGAFLAFGTLGILRFDDVFNRLHAQTKSTTLGLGGVLLAFAVLLFPAPAAPQAIAAIAFVLLTAPASATAIARGALAAGHADVYEHDGEE